MRAKVGRIASLLVIVVVCLAFLALSFHPRARFAHTRATMTPWRLQSYHCNHDLIYQAAEPGDVLYFGTSRTMAAIDSGYVESAYRAISGNEKTALVFTIGAPSPSLHYSFFRDYLRHNPPPEAALFELTPVIQTPSAVPYLHLLFPILAPPYLFVDVLRSWSFVNSRLFAVSDFLRLLIRHVDLSLTNLLVRDRHFLVPREDNCSDDKFAAVQSAQFGKHPQSATLNAFDMLLSGYPVTEPERRERNRRIAQAGSFQELMDIEAERLLPPGGWDKAGDYEVLLERYAGTGLAKRIERHGPEWSLRRPKLWYRGPTKELWLGYYQRAVELGRAHGVDVEFYYVPSLYFPEPSPEQIAMLEDMLGAPVHTLPFKHAQVAYHHYVDRVHVLPEARGLMSAWAASLMDEVLNH